MHEEFKKRIKEFEPNMSKKGRMSNSALDELKWILDYASDIYYNSGESVITDQEFDKYLNKYQIYRKYGAGIAPRSNQKTVDTKNEVPELVGTTDKVNSISDLKDWLSDRLSKLGLSDNDKINLLVSEKYDGNSVVTFINKDGHVFKALTRGKDGIGADVTQYFKDRSLSKKVEIMKLFNKDTEFLAIKNEAIMLDDDLVELNNIRSKNGLKEFTNNRSAVAGITSSNDSIEYSKYITLVPLAIKLVGNKEISRLDQILLINDIYETSHESLKSNPFVVYSVSGTLSEVEKDISVLYDNIDAYRYQRSKADKSSNTMDYMVDGLVIEFAEDKYRSKLGRDKDRNKYDVALKFSYQTQKSKVKGIHWDMGKTQRLTPVVDFEPLLFNGNLCVQASLSNYKRFKEMGLSVGDSIIVQYRNDVLCYAELDPTESYNKITKIKAPTKCPICDKPLIVDNGTFLLCTNKDCPSNIIGRATNFLTKLGIKGIKENIITSLVDNGFIKDDLSDLFSIDYNKLKNIDGWKDKSVSVLKSKIDSIDEVYDYQLVGSIGIPGVSLETTKSIFSQYSLDDLNMNFIYAEGIDSDWDYSNFLSSSLTKPKLLKVDGVSDKTADKIISFVKDHQFELTSLSLSMNVKSYKEFIESNGGSSIKSGLNIVFSGFRDNDLKDILELAGNKVTSSGVSGKTDILVVKDKSKITSKIAKAKELGKHVMDIDEFKSYMDI